MLGGMWVVQWVVDFGKYGEVRRSGSPEVRKSGSPEVLPVRKVLAYTGAINLAAERLEP
jgi:hypothetical protein